MSWGAVASSAMSRIHYEVDDDLHRRAKAAAALEGVSLKVFLERALEAAVARSEGVRPRGAAAAKGAPARRR